GQGWVKPFRGFEKARCYLSRSDDVRPGAHRDGRSRDAPGGNRFSGETDLHRQVTPYGREHAQTSTPRKRKSCTQAATGQARDCLERRGHASPDGSVGEGGRE